MAGNLRLRSMRTKRTPFWSYSNSTHEPRYGMILARYPCADSFVKKTPGERWSCDTMTRSVPLMTNVPCSVISGMSPKKTSSSLASRIVLTPVSGSLS